MKKNIPLNELISLKIILNNPLSGYYINGYYINLSLLLDTSGHHGILVYNGSGIPMYAYDPPLGVRYNPTIVALFALENYQLRDMKSLHKATKWLIAHDRRRGKALV